MGFYDEGRLVAVLDLITSYPDAKSAFIGWFMVDGELQKQGIGSRIIADVRAALKGWGFTNIELGCVKENVEAISFWEGMGFKPTGEEKTVGKHTDVTYRFEG